MDLTSQSSSDPQHNSGIITRDSTHSPPLRANEEISHEVESTDGGDLQPQGFAKVSVRRVSSNGCSHGLVGVTSSSSSSSSLNDDGRSESCEGGESGEGGENGEGEVEEFYSLLDSTLRDGCADVEEAGAAGGGGGEAALQPGRLQERIAALRRLQ